MSSYIGRGTRVVLARFRAAPDDVREERVGLRISSLGHRWRFAPTMNVLLSAQYAYVGYIRGELETYSNVPRLSPSRAQARIWCGAYRLVGPVRNRAGPPLSRQAMSAGKCLPVHVPIATTFNLFVIVYKYDMINKL